MATPLGHGLAGWALFRLLAEGRRIRGLGLACVALAIAPDLDFLPGLLRGRPALYHQGATHSLAAACLGGAIALAVLRPPPSQRLRVAAIAFAAYASHLVLDLFGPDGRPPIGIPLLWPMSQESWLSRRTLLPGVHHAAHTDSEIGAWLGGIWSWHNAVAIGAEALFVSPLLVGALLLQRTRQRGPAGVPRGAAGGGEPSRGASEASRNQNRRPAPRGRG